MHNCELFLQYMMDNHTGENPLDRNMMTYTEKKCADRLVKEGKLVKGTAEGDARRRIYYFDPSIKSIENADTSQTP